MQADEQMYWYAAQTLAKAGYVVLTFDPQGQGQSDTFGEGDDRNEGFPAQSDGRPFFDGTEDAINFFFSTPAHPYVPVKSCSTGTSHAAKQDRRVAAGLNAAYNPLTRYFDGKRFGLAGHSYGAAGVSYIGQWDPRVKAIVAWDNLAGADPSKGIFDNSNPAEQPCPADPAAREPAPITKPALGMSADYFLPPTPNTSDPDPSAKSVQSHAYSDAGVDTGEIIIRGGSHLDFSFIPNPGVRRDLRGADEIAWYTTAWFDKYVKRDRGRRREAAHQPLAPRRCGGGRSTPTATATCSPSTTRRAWTSGWPNGQRFTCEDMRPGCGGKLTDRDGYTGQYDYVNIATSPDG